MKLHSAVFYSNNLEKVKKFYLEALKLKLDYEHEGEFISFWFANKVRLGIKQKREEREIPGSGTVFIEIDDIDSVYTEMQHNGVAIAKPLMHQDWATNFSIYDPDNNKVQFVQSRNQ